MREGSVCGILVGAKRLGELPQGQVGSWAVARRRATAA